jgi:hypothetical protein
MPRKARLQPRVQGFGNPPDAGGRERERERAGAAGPSRTCMFGGTGCGAEALRGRGRSPKRGLETHLDVGLAPAALDVALAATPPGTRPDRTNAMTPNRSEPPPSAARPGGSTETSRAMLPPPS